MNRPLTSNILDRRKLGRDFENFVYDVSVYREAERVADLLAGKTKEDFIGSLNILCSRLSCKGSVGSIVRGHSWTYHREIIGE